MSLYPRKQTTSCRAQWCCPTNTSENPSAICYLLFVIRTRASGEWPPGTSIANLIYERAVIMRGNGSVGWESLSGALGGTPESLRGERINRAVPFFGCRRNSDPPLLTSSLRPFRATPGQAFHLSPLTSHFSLSGVCMTENLVKVRDRFTLLHRRPHLPTIWIPLTSKYLR